MTYKIEVQNVANDHVHFARLITLPDSIEFPYEKIVESLLFLYRGLDVLINIKIEN